MDVETLEQLLDAACADVAAHGLKVALKAGDPKSCCPLGALFIKAGEDNGFPSSYTVAKRFDLSHHEATAFVNGFDLGEEASNYAVSLACPAFFQLGLKFRRRFTA